jgi:hypothetical protein
MFYICTMKVRLLKRVRKEFSIKHYPNGFERTIQTFTHSYSTKMYGKNTFTLENSKGEVLDFHDTSKEHTHHTYQEIYDGLYKSLMKEIRVKYAEYGTRRLLKKEKQQQPNTLWY